MKIISSSSLFGYKSAYWTNDKTLNPTSPLYQQKDAKYPAFSTASFNMMRMCTNTYQSNDIGSNCVTHAFKQTYNSAQAFFSQGYLRDPLLDQEGIYSAFGVQGHKNCGMQVCERSSRNVLEVFAGLKYLLFSPF